MRPQLMPEITNAPHSRLTAPFTHDEVSAIDDVRFGLRHTSRTQTIRFLVQKGLEAVAAEAGPPQSSASENEVC